MTTSKVGDLRRAFAKVPLEGGNPKYVPLNKLPVGTVLTFSTKTAYPPIETPEVNGKPEESVTYLPEGTYKLRILEWGVTELLIGNREIRLVKPLYNRMSVTSPFIANYDDMGITFRLQTGNVQWINVNGIFRLNVQQIKQERPRKPPQRRSRKHGPRGKYRPLRNRRF